MRLSEHFQLSEFTISQTAARRGINNNPNEVVVVRLKRLCELILEPARAALGAMRISSGYRCPALNAAIGGSRTSAHMLGYAADVNPLGVSKLEFARWVIAHCGFDQIILEFGTPTEPAWIHVSCDPRGRGQVLRTVGGGGYVGVVEI